MQTKLPLVNEQWTRTHDTQTLNSTNTQRITFANESVAPVLFSDVESVLCPLEQSGGGFRYQGDGGIVAPEASRDANTLRRALL
jgi:hypothetical protein